MPIAWTCRTRNFPEPCFPFRVLVWTLRNAFIRGLVLDSCILFKLGELRTTVVRDAVLTGLRACKAAVGVPDTFGSVALCAKYICHMTSPLPCFRLALPL